MNKNEFMKIINEMNERLDVLDTDCNIDGLEALESFYNWFLESYMEAQ